MSVFTDTLQRWLEGIAANKDQWALHKVLEPLFDRYSSCALSSAGLVISSGGATTVKIGASDFYAVANGVLVKVAASTTLPALVGTITATDYNVFCFFVDSAGNLTVAMGTQGTTLAGVVFPSFPKWKALIGFIIVTYSGTFTGGTTALDTATTVYVNPLTAWDPSLLLGVG